MSGTRQMEVHYINMGFPYTVTDSFMDLFEGLNYTQTDYAVADSLPDQGNVYWPVVHSNPYKYGFSGLGSSPYYSNGQTYDLNDYVQSVDGGRRAWGTENTCNNVDSGHIIFHESPHSSPLHTEECIQGHQSSNSPLDLWHDSIDLDNMTYEELLDLGEAVGTQSRGLSQEQISSLPVTKYKCGLFSRKRTRRERCVICQMNYKRGERQMTLPCKHVYHASCISRWLSINKVCPVCFAEVNVEQLRKKW